MISDLVNKIFGEQNATYIYIIGACAIIVSIGSIYSYISKDWWVILDSNEMRELYFNDLRWFDAEIINDIPSFLYSSEPMLKFLVSAVYNYTEESLSLYVNINDKAEFSRLYKYLRTKPSYEDFQDNPFSSKIIYNTVITVKHDFLFIPSTIDMLY